MGVGALCRRDAFFICRVQSAVPDIVHDRTGKQIYVLQYDTQRTPQVCLFDFVDVDAVVANLAVCQIVEPVDQVRDRGLSGTGRPDKRHLFAGLGVQAHIMQHDFFRHITEVHVKELHVPCHTGIGDRAVPVRVLPRPHAGAVVGFCQHAVLLLGIDQRDIALIGFRLLVQQFEDASCSCQCHDDRTGLLGDLADRHGEAAAQLQERGNCTQCQTAYAVERQCTAQHCQQHILDIAQIVHDRHKDIGEAVRPCGVLEQFVVVLVEVRLGLFLVAEHLDDFLSVNHFLDIAVYRTNGVLLLHKESTAFAAYKLGNKHHQCHKRQHKQRQPDTQPHHCHEHCNDCDDRRKDLRDTLCQHLPERIGIIGVQAHYIAAGVGVEKANGQRLHMGEHLVPNGFQNALCHNDHEPVIEQRTQNAGGIQHAQLCQCPCQSGKVTAAVQQHGRNIVIDQRLQKRRTCHACHSTDQNADKHQYQLHPVPFHIREQPDEAFSGTLSCSRHHHTAGRRSLSSFTHCGTLPFCCDSYTSR